jgi:hypothetical protein
MKKKKLVLNKVTLRALNQLQTADVGGGTDHPINSHEIMGCYDTMSCGGTCGYTCDCSDACDSQNCDTYRGCNWGYE